MKNERGVVILAVLFIGLFALMLGANIGRKVQRYEDNNPNREVLVP